MNMMTANIASPEPPASPIAALRALPLGRLAAKWRELERHWEDLDRARRLAELFAAFDRDDMELGAELLIAEMDARDGDPDIGPDGDELDGNSAEDEAGYAWNSFDAGNAAGCPISDPDAEIDDGHFQLLSEEERDVLRLRWPS